MKQIAVRILRLMAIIFSFVSLMMALLEIFQPTTKGVERTFLFVYTGVATLMAVLVYFQNRKSSL